MHEREGPLPTPGPEHCRPSPPTWSMRHEAAIQRSNAAAASFPASSGRRDVHGRGLRRQPGTVCPRRKGTSKPKVGAARRPGEPIPACGGRIVVRLEPPSIACTRSCTD